MVALEATIVTMQVSTDCVNNFEFMSLGYSGVTITMWAFHFVVGCRLDEVVML